MLKLRRKLGETVNIAGGIVVKIERIHGRHGVELSFDAPREIKILRGELELRTEVGSRKSEVRN